MREVQSNVLRMLHAYGIPADVVAEYDCVPIRIRQVGDSVKLQTMFGARSVKAALGHREQVHQAFEVAEWLAKRSYPRVPRFIRNRYGDAYIRDGDRFYYMTDWVGGRDLDIDQAEQLHGAMAELADWQLAAKGALPTKGTASRRTFVQELQALVDEGGSFWSRVRTKPNRTEFERLFTGFAKDVLTQAQEVLKDLEKLSWDELEQNFIADGWVCHGKFIPDGIRYDGENYAIVNYESIHCGCPLTDVVDFLDVCMQEHQWNAELTEAVIDTYLEKMERPSWLYYLVALLKAPLQVLRLVHSYQNQEFPDEGLYTDALEQSLQQEKMKASTLDELAKLHQRNAALSEPAVHSETQEGTADDLVHADLPANGGEVAVDARPVKLEQGTRTSAKRRIDAKTPAKVSKEPSERFTIKRYRPKRRTAHRSEKEKHPEFDQINLWGEAHNPHE